MRRSTQLPQWGLTRMIAELISLRVLTVFGSDQDRHLLRQAASLVSVPIEVHEARSTTQASAFLARGGIDIVFLDAAFAGAERGAVLAAARAAKPAPFVFLVAA